MEENKVEEIQELEEVTNEAEGIKISSDVIAVIAGVAVSEVDGVYSMAGGFAGGITEVLKGKKNLAKGIKVESEGNKAKIDVNIIVEYGARIPDVAFGIQNKVKTSVEEMTGLKVEEVNDRVKTVHDNLHKQFQEIDKYKAILAFINYIHRTRGASENTEVSYRRDLTKLAEYLSQEAGIDSWEKVTQADLN